ncbi:MAG: phytanoyl-CoA dioxygenase family protein [Verrucomicrobiota bacterium]
MVDQLEHAGFEIRRSIFTAREIELMRSEASRIAQAESSVCIRNLCAKSKFFSDLAYSDVLKSLLPDGVAPVRSILFDKTPSQNWPVLWHQDLTISTTEEHPVEHYTNWSIKDGACHVQPPLNVLESMVTARIHLDSTPKSNGALWVAPGSHRLGRLPSDQIDIDETQAVICECEPGDVLLMSPLILHASKKSVGQERHRRVVHIEFADRSTLAPELQWAEAA